MVRVFHVRTIIVRTVVVPVRARIRVHFQSATGVGHAAHGTQAPIEGENRSVTINEILGAARERAERLGLPYAGALLPKEAFEIWKSAPGARLVDVRTRAEWDYVGRIPGAAEIEILTYPGNRPNDSFLLELQQQVDKESLVMFICRSGGRSHNAAAIATGVGYRACYNVLEGFEGDKDPQGHRNSLGGWRVAGLPWTQG